MVSNYRKLISKRSANSTVDAAIYAAAELVHAQITQFNEAIHEAARLVVTQLNESRLLAQKIAA